MDSRRINANNSYVHLSRVFLFVNVSVYVVPTATASVDHNGTDA